VKLFISFVHDVRSLFTIQLFVATSVRGEELEAVATMISCLPTQALALLAVFVYATHTTQAIAFEWKPGLIRSFTAMTFTVWYVVDRVQDGRRSNGHSLKPIFDVRTAHLSPRTLALLLLPVSAAAIWFQCRSMQTWATSLIWGISNQKKSM